MLNSTKNDGKRELRNFFFYSSTFSYLIFIIFIQLRSSRFILILYYIFYIMSPKLAIIPLREFNKNIQRFDRTIFGRRIRKILRRNIYTI
jgi:hypothetical protein